MGSKSFPRFDVKARLTSGRTPHHPWFLPILYLDHRNSEDIIAIFLDGVIKLRNLKNQRMQSLFSRVGWKLEGLWNTGVPPENSIRQARLAFQGFPEHTLSGRKTFLIITQRGLGWAFQRNSPIPREIEPPEKGPVIAIPMVGGLHHRYKRVA